MIATCAPPRILRGDCRCRLEEIEDDSVDLIITSPPYADQRKNSYGGVAPERYVEWFLPISEHLLRVLKPSGTFILNIKERVVGGERRTYVIELILAMMENYIRVINKFSQSFIERFCEDGLIRWEKLLRFNSGAKGE